MVKLILEKGKIILGIIGLYFLYGITSAVWLAFTKEGALQPWQTALITFVQIAAILFFIWLAQRHQLLTFNKKLINKNLFLVPVLSVLALMMTSYISDIIMKLEGVSTTTNNQATLNHLMTRTPVALMFLLVVITAPIIEEIIFRGFMAKILFKPYFGLGVFIAADIFSLTHIPTNIGSFFVYFGMGMVWGFTFYKTKHLEYSILAHMVWNGLVFMTMLS